ncbi:hypothetical protein PFICI_00182 [Pestalotiopsis fici W106-1]|uniref:Uncharacterized protein n=1 Tax=Pestalotiopsis fici (strain W106-1 / CGMCC3.15140) TaxID=1229662 RepID=W3XK07_PESFW|nr:uncharacterized protein PFICI_00182 [Pestalotiopsis fici W106-1]ETS86354.1 hypothetical protein PFICI_00182 [Pestalotiopsis fici W106-1]
MKFYSAAVLLLAGSVAARNCKEGLDYCGRTLLDIGKYQPQIDQSLADAHQAEVDGGKHDLFHCLGGSNGVIAFKKHCGNGCTDGGSNKNDYCS